MVAWGVKHASLLEIGVSVPSQVWRKRCSERMRKTEFASVSRFFFFLSFLITVVQAGYLILCVLKR